MIENNLRLEYEKDRAVLKFEGELIFDNSNHFKEEAKNRLGEKENIKDLIIDLNKVPYLDSSGIGVILSLFKFMRQRDGSVAVANPNEKISRVFEVTKMTEIISIYESIDKAFADLK